MEKNTTAKFGSFTRINGYKMNDFAISPKTTYTPKITPFKEDEEETQESNYIDNETSDDDGDGDKFISDVHQICSDVDQYVESLSSSLSQVPDCVEDLCKLIESRISVYSSGAEKFRNEEETFTEAVMGLYKLTNAFTEFSSSDTAESLNRTSVVLQRAMTFIEDQFWNLLDDYKTRGKSSSGRKKLCSFSDEVCLISESSETTEKKLKMLAYTMVFSGYETECYQVYAVERRTVFKDELEKLEFEKFNIQDIQKMTWETLEGEIARWIRVVKHCSSVLFPRERKLVDSVFSDHPWIGRSIFTNLARTVVIQLLDFAEAVAMTKKSGEKLFKFLDMYETLRDLAPAVTGESDDNEHELKSEIEAAGDRLGEAAVNIFTDLENSIKKDVAKTPVPGGTVHPLTRYVMNYLKYASEYKDTLAQILETHKKFDTGSSDESSDNTSPFAIQLVSVMDLLDANLEAKSKLYKDQSLCYIFLMNNGRYILQKVKGSTEIHQVMGDTWCRKRSTVVRHYHKSYQRETWGRLLQTINLEGLQAANGKVSKTVVKEKFKNFSNMFDEIHKTQSSWIVSDEQLLSELRASISAIVIPAYRSFLGRYRHLLEGARSQAEKYIKYQPEDLETLIEGLFEGNTMSMARRR